MLDGTAPPPHSLEAEQAVLASAMLDPGIAGRLLETLTPSAFYASNHQAVWRAIARLHQADKLADPVTIGDELGRMGVPLEDAGGYGYLVDLASSIPTTALAGQYARIVTEHHISRQRREIALALLNAADNPTETARLAGELQALDNQSQGDDAERFLTFDDLLSLPDPIWLVEDVLEADGLAVMFSPPNQGKSLLALDLAARMSCGLDWNGKHVVQGPAVYLAGEGMKGLGKRVRAWSRLNGWRADRLAAIEASQIGFSLADAASVAKFIRMVKRLPEPPRLIILDTLATVTPGVEENSSKELGLAIDRAKYIRRETGATVLIIHHAGKDGRDLRGSTSLRGAVDTVLKVEQDSEGLVTMTVDKQRDGEKGLSLFWKLERVEGTSSVAPVPVLVERQKPSKQKPLTKNEEEVLRVLRESDTPLSFTEILKRAIRPPSDDHPGGGEMPKGTLNGACNSLERSGWILRDPASKKYHLGTSPEGRHASHFEEGSSAPFEHPELDDFPGSSSESEKLMVTLSSPSSDALSSEMVVQPEPPTQFGQFGSSRPPLRGGERPNKPNKADPLPVEDF